MELITARWTCKSIQRKTKHMVAGPKRATKTSAAGLQSRKKGVPSRNPISPLGARLVSPPSRKDLSRHRTSNNHGRKKCMKRLRTELQVVAPRQLRGCREIKCGAWKPERSSPKDERAVRRSCRIAYVVIRNKTRCRVTMNICKYMIPNLLHRWSLGFVCIYSASGRRL